MDEHAAKFLQRCQRGVVEDCLGSPASAPVPVPVKLMAGALQRCVGGALSFGNASTPRQAPLA
jgi:hypothetical protein